MTLKNAFSRTSLAVQWLRLHSPKTGGTDFIPCWETKISHAAQHGLKKKNHQEPKQTKKSQQTSKRRKLPQPDNLFNPQLQKPTTNTIFNDERLSTFPVRLRPRQGRPLSPLLKQFSVILKALGSAIMHEKEIRGIQIGNKK